ncbi:MAG: (d)CMP kinase [Actinomycetota bacterium]|nr:(d)CMP kinase [Actinomycetota bacterium]
MAQELRSRYLDTGALYRAVTWAVLEAGVRPEDAMGVARIAQAVVIDASADPNAPATIVDGRQVDGFIRSAQVTAAVSVVSAVPSVRRRLLAIQRRFIAGGGIVVEGRDIGTVVAPDATVKVFLTASTAARTQRRGAELGAADPVDLAATAADLTRRDSLDASRTQSPLRAASDAVHLDTSALSIAEVVAALVALVRQALAGGAGRAGRTGPAQVP